MELNAELIKIITSGGLSVILFVIWYITARNMQKQYKELQDQQLQVINRMFAIMDADMKYHELLTGVLGRIELKLDLSLKKERSHE